MGYIGNSDRRNYCTRFFDLAHHVVDDVLVRCIKKKMQKNNDKVCSEQEQYTEKCPNEMDDMGQYCDSMDTICGLQMSICQIVTVLSLILSVSIFTILLVGRSSSWICAMKSVTAVWSTVLALAIVTSILWLDIMSKVGSLPVQYLTGFNTSSSSSLKTFSENVCTPFHFTCWTLGSGFPIWIAGTGLLALTLPFVVRSLSSGYSPKSDDLETPLLFSS